MKATGFLIRMRFPVWVQKNGGWCVYTGQEGMTGQTVDVQSKAAVKSILLGREIEPGTYVPKKKS